MHHDDPLAALPRELEPSAALRGRVTRALHERGLIRRELPPAHAGWWRVAAAMLLLAAGAALGRATGRAETAHSPAAAAAHADAQYVLLLYEPASFNGGPHEALAREYSAWARALGARFVSGEALGEARVLGGTAPPSEPTGFFLVRAASFDDAVMLARDCPHLRRGGVVSVRTVPAT